MQTVARQAHFQCPECDEEQEACIPPLAPIAYVDDWPKFISPACCRCGAVLWLMYLLDFAT